VANGNSNIIPLHRGVAMAAARPVREQGRPPSSAPVLSPVPVEQLRAMFAERSFAERFDGPPRNVEVKPSLRQSALLQARAFVSRNVRGQHSRHGEQVPPMAAEKDPLQTRPRVHH
jgi:hypothetical protein